MKCVKKEILNLKHIIEKDSHRKERIIMKKKNALWILIFVTLCFAACGGKENSGSGQSGSGSTESSTESTENFPDEEETTHVSEMGYLKDAVVEVLGENYWPNMTIEPTTLSDMYGITEEMYEDYFAEMPMISTNVDTLIIVKAKEGQAEAVEAALTAYRETLISDTMQYPMNHGKIQASRIEAMGNYVCFVQLGADVTDAMDQGEDAAITQCQEENEKALDAIREIVTQ